ncbi:MAG TPA: DUF3488 and transglutaminase-like domain-containing protein [Rhodocyclaceae bacterium]
MGKRKTEPPLDPRLAPWLIASAAVTLVPHFTHTSYWQIALIAAVVAWRIWLWHRQAPLPSRWLITIITVAGVAGVALEYRRLFGQDSGVALLLLFMAMKLMETRSPRDARVVVMLGYFLLLTHYFYQDGIPTGAWMIVALTVVTATLIRIETAALESGALLRKSAFMLAQSIPVMGILFLLFPRIDGPLWGLPQESRRNTTGLSEVMSPGSISALTQSAEIAFRVQFRDEAPANSSLYWRGPVLSEFDGSTWRVQRLPPTLPTRPPVAEAGSATHHYTLTLEPHQQRWLLALDMPLAAPRDAVMNSSYALLRRRAVQERIRYEAESATRHRAGIAEANEILATATLLPRGSNPRTRQLVERWRAETGGGEALIAQALRHFRNEPFAYTLQPPLLGEHPVDDFLFRTRRGFCEHYASAFAVMMRIAGMPARIVTGYQGGASNPVDGYWVVRQADAHAWVEVWLRNRGWVRVDPTAAIAPSRIEAGVAAAIPQTEPLPGVVRGGIDWLRQARYQWEALNNGWNQWVLGYDQARQTDLLGRLGLSTRWQSLIGTLVVAAAITVVVLALWAMRRERQHDPAIRLWLAFTRHMARRGSAREPWEGPYDYARRLAERFPDLAEASTRFCAAYARSRYGSATDDDLLTMTKTLKLIRSR